MNGWRMAFVLVAAALLTACGTVPPSQNRDNTQEIQELHAKAQAAYNSNDFALAQNIYEKIVAQTEVNGETWFMLGNIYATKGEHERALSAYKNALRVNGRDPRVWNNISVIHLKDAWEAAQTVKKLSVKEDPANIQSTKIIEVLAGLSFLSGNSPPLKAQPDALSGASAVQGPALRVVPAPIQQVTSGQTVVTTTLDGVALPVPGANNGIVQLAPALPGSRSSVALTRGDAETARGSERNNKTAAVDNKPAAPASPETPAGAVQTGVEPTSAEYAEYALRNRLPLQNVRGTSADHRADAFYVKAVDRLSIRGKSISGGENQNLTLLKGATMRVPLLLGGVYKFGSKEAPIITYQGTVIPEATVLQSWFRFIPAPAR